MQRRRLSLCCESIEGWEKTESVCLYRLLSIFCGEGRGCQQPVGEGRESGSRGDVMAVEERIDSGGNFVRMWSGESN